MEQAYRPIDSDFRRTLEQLIDEKPFIRIQYYSDIREFLNTTAMPKELIQKDRAEYLRLATGEEIRLDRLVRLGDNPAPGYGADYFKCDI